MRGLGRSLAIALAMSLILQASLAEAKRRKRRAARRSPPIAALTREGLPNVQAAGALVVDMDDGTILYGKNPDSPRFIASVSKIFVAMVVRRKGLVLDGVTEITPEDRLAARGGARTHLYEFEKYTNLDLLKAMMIASDNRAPHALGRAVGLTDAELVEEMNRLARDLGLRNTTFTDVSGLNGNTSSPRDLATAMRAYLKDPLLAEIASTRFTSIVSVDAQRPKRVNYANTNRLVHSNHNTILGGKTGYTDEALYCLVVASEINGKKVCTVILGAYGELTRYGDYSRIKGWLTRNAPAEGDDLGPEDGGAVGAVPGDAVAAPAD